MYLTPITHLLNRTRTFIPRLCCHDIASFVSLLKAPLKPHTIPALVHVDDVDILLEDIAPLPHDSALLNCLVPVDIPHFSHCVRVNVDAHFLLSCVFDSIGLGVDLEAIVDAEVIKRLLSVGETRYRWQVVLDVVWRIKWRRDGRRRDIVVW